MAKINSCLRQKPGKDFSKFGEQTLANATRIDARLTSKQLQDKYTHASTYAVGISNAYGKQFGPNGTIFIGSEWFSNPTDWTVNGRGGSLGRTPLQNAYVHELGNIAAQSTGHDFAVKGSTDPDSGYAFQACVFNEKVQMKTP